MGVNMKKCERIIRIVLAEQSNAHVTPTPEGGSWDHLLPKAKKAARAIGHMPAIFTKEERITDVTHWNYVSHTIAHPHYKDICETCFKFIGEAYMRRLEARNMATQGEGEG
jgi:hypothetical protein